MFSAFIAWPDPIGPVRKMFALMASRTGVTLSIAASSSPPSMIVSVPSMAFVRAPETGASTRLTPRDSSSGASESVAEGSAELMSITTAPSGSASAMPPSRIAFRTIAPLGSIVTTTPTSAKSSGPARRGLTVLGGPALGQLGVGVDADDVEAGPRDVRAHRPAHRAEADEADLRALRGAH